MISKLLRIALPLLIGIHAQCQMRGDIRSQGAPPPLFKQAIQQLIIDNALAEQQEGDRRWESKAKARFQNESNFALANILKSGNVVYNNPITQYAEAVLDRIVPKETRIKPVEIYLLKTSQANAFATHQGIIFVTVGLLARLDNEAELAFILAHEYAHIQEGHSVSKSMEKIGSIKERRRRGYSFDDFINHMSDYSKLLELAADSIAFQTIKTSPYHIEHSSKALEVLRYADLPFAEIELDLRFFESENFKIPKDYFLETAIDRDYKDEDDSEESTSTHPSVDVRVKAIEDLKQDADTTGKTYKPDEALLLNIKKQCREAVIRYDLGRAYYLRSLYHSYCLLSETPNDEYYLRSIAKALYGHAKYRNARESINDELLQTPGQISRFYFLFDEMKNEELSLVALRKMIEINETLNDHSIKQLIINLHNDLLAQESSGYSIEDLKFHVPISNTSGSEAAKRDSSHVNPDKHEKMVKSLLGPSNVKKNQKEDEDNDGFHLHAFCDMDKAHVLTLLNTAPDSNRYAVDVPKPDYINAYERNRAEKRRLKKEAVHGKALGLKDITYVYPRAISINKKKGINKERSIELEQRLTKNINAAGNSSTLNVQVIQVELGDDLTDQMNINSTLAALFYELSLHQDVSFGTKMICSELEYARPLKKELGTRHICYAGEVHYQQPTQNKAEKTFYCFLASVLAPIPLYMVYTPSHFTYYFDVVFDLESGEITGEYEQFYRKKLSTSAHYKLMRDRIAGLSAISW